MSRVFRKGDRIFLETDEQEHYYYDESSVPLGQGAMGVVYLGNQYNHNGIIKPVAIKRVKDKYSNISSIRMRAKQEASLMFGHPNLVEMLGYCEAMPDRGPIFIISKYVPGDTIDKYVSMNLQNLKNQYKRICELCLHICEALDYIHSYKIIHADIKPSNIMVESGINVRLMDLGISQVNVIHDLGSTGMMGTPRYAAPEQFLSSSSMDARTDIYELGVTIYELLAKRNPFDGESIEDIKEKHNTVTLPYVYGVPKVIIDVLRKATKPLPIHRYQSALEFKSALSGALQKKQSVFHWLWG